MPILNDYNEGKEDGHRHFGASPVPDNIKRKWLIEVAKRGEKVNNKNKEIYNKKKVKRIPFAIIDNLYFQDFLNLLQPSYTSPHKDALSGSIFDREIAQIVVKLKANL
ncbi:2729_t:CDS:2 [Cetraspora pellucida]|uniref:2729_t:CDS:1 n=1 Tax=Cetraspora pellucida TaxID=1433469 RepID=A0A9N9HWV4_9GLOM|nr:2729_t:CDS:2 [Cetraspora pellucida]